MTPADEPRTIIVLGFSPYYTHEIGDYSLLSCMRGINDRNALGANVDWAVSRYGVKMKLDQYGAPTDQEVRVNTGEITNHQTGGDPRPFVMWPSYLPGDVRLFVCSKVTIEDTGPSKILFDGDYFARDIVKGIPRVVTHFQDGAYGKSDLPANEFLDWDYHTNGVFHLPRDMRNDRSIQASMGAMDQLVKGLWQNGLDFPFGTYKDIVSSAVVPSK